MIDPPAGWHYDPAMRLLPSIALCLLLLPACTTPQPDGPDEIVATPVSADQFANQAAVASCAQLFECECGDNPVTPQSEPLPWASEADCVAEKEPEFQATLDQVLATGGAFSDECGGEYIAAIQRTACKTAWDYVLSGEATYNPVLCPLAVHEQAIGAECDPWASTLTNDCGEDKYCAYETNTCVARGPIPVAKGGNCDGGYYDFPCEEGLVCGYDGNGNTCQPPAKAGDPCPNYSCLGADLTCDSNTLICIANATEGEPCEQRSCAAGLYCDGGMEFICVAQYEAGHGCANDSVCAEGGRCIGNVCQPPEPLACNSL